MTTKSASSTPTTPPAPAPPADRTPVNKEAFLQLLVAQIKHQNPLDPADGAQFLSQLAQFSELEQMLGIRSELAGIREDLKPDTEPETGETENV
jgi:flagellar basal-body rod modification protein FlgD